MTKVKQPVMLVILDGFGIGDKKDPFNAIATANLSVLPSLWKNCPHSQLSASGESVGLPKGQMGNSEVGHLNLGSGRIVYQELSRITRDIESGAFFARPVLNEIMERTASSGSLHMMGLLSDGGVHSSSTHLYALLEMAKQKGIKNVYLHLFLDGRDVPPKSAEGYIKELETVIEQTGTGIISTVSGRYYAMDRDKRWDRVEKAYRAVAEGNGLLADTALAAVQQAYERGETDEFVQPTVICRKPIEPGDSVLFFNFRPDRARELTKALVLPSFKEFPRTLDESSLYMATMTQYEEGLPVHLVYAPETLKNTLGETVSKQGCRQLRIAETEKYAHVTYFFNGGIEEPFEGEDRILIPSPKVATYDLQPEMSAEEVCAAVIEKIESQLYDLIILNFANPDMVGHTGNLQAAQKAVETVDSCVGRIVEAMKKQNGVLLITADHGNADMMRSEATGMPHTAHTTNPVPLILVGNGWEQRRLKNGILADIAPTLLTLAGLDIPSEMTGSCLIDD